MPRPAKRKDGEGVPPNFIADWRNRPGFDKTQEWVSEQLDAIGCPISANYISKLERSIHPVDSRDLLGLAIVLKTTPIALMVGPPGDPLVRAYDLLSELNKADQEDAVSSLANWLSSVRRRKA